MASSSALGLAVLLMLTLSPFALADEVPRASEDHDQFCGLCVRVMDVKRIETQRDVKEICSSLSQDDAPNSMCDELSEALEFDNRLLANEGRVYPLKPSLFANSNYYCSNVLLHRPAENSTQGAPPQGDPLDKRSSLSRVYRPCEHLSPVVAPFTPPDASQSPSCHMCVLLLDWKTAQPESPFQDFCKANQDQLGKLADQCFEVGSQMSSTVTEELNLNNWPHPSNPNMILCPAFTACAQVRPSSNNNAPLCDLSLRRRQQQQQQQQLSASLSGRPASSFSVMMPLMHLRGPVCSFP